ncbi:hypothetical protein GCM10022244_10840 [Streptomyces gulbargensis]|uniref:Uncharacterized protein n=1 Tax=Streptomyces gulbargensis TaxID=364901 RepID=A0ABP7LKF6_9ACTN
MARGELQIELVQDRVLGAGITEGAGLVVQGHRWYLGAGARSLRLHFHEMCNRRGSIQ